MLTISGRLITPFVLGSMSVGLNILIRHSFMDLWFWITALVPWPQLLFSPMYLPFINPVWSLSINLSITDLILLSIAPEAILYTVSRSLSGLHFFRNCFGLFSFGRHGIIPCLCVIDSSLISYPKFSDLRTKIPNCLQKPWKIQQKIRLALDFCHVSYYKEYLIFPYKLTNPLFYLPLHS